MARAATNSSATTDALPVPLTRALASLVDRRARPRRKVAAQVAARLEADIIGAGWPVGTVFGSEADLLERYGVSSAVFREAIGLVEHHRVAAMRRGPGGGLVVTVPDSSAVARAATVFMEYAGATNSDILHARLIVEPLAASLAAERITEDGVVHLRSILADEQHLDESLPATEYIERHGRLHHAIAELTGNPVVRLFVEVLARLSVQYNADLSPEEITTGAATIRAAHAELGEAVIAGDPGLAAHRAVRNLENIGEWFRPRPARAHRDRDVTPLGRSLGAEPAGPPLAPPNRKLGEVVAREIQFDISQRGWPIGDVLGSESELLERYGVSRGVLREAVRLLEHHSIAMMRRGPGGGLVVTEPDPDAHTEAIVLFLEYEHVTADALTEVRTALELGCVDLVTERVTPDGVRWLRDALVVDDDDPVNGGGESLHLRIAALTGNPILAVFVASLTSLFEHHAGGTRPEAPSASPNGEGDGDGEADGVAHVHEGIVDAIADADRSLARHRMLRHLQGLRPWYR